MAFYKRKIKNKSKMKKLKFIISLILIFNIIFIFLFIISFEKNVLPTALDISEKYAADIVNRQINTAVEEMVNEEHINTNDFFENSFNDNQNMNYLSVNSILINKICSKAAVKINEKIKYFENDDITLPVGIFSGINILSSVGPKCSIKIYSAGETMIDYETKFLSVGINQINFQVWLNINTKVNAVNPMYEKEVSVKRKLMLVNTLYNGPVPNTYLNGLNK